MLETNMILWLGAWADGPLADWSGWEPFERTENADERGENRETTKREEMVPEIWCMEKHHEAPRHG